MAEDPRVEGNPGNEDFRVQSYPFYQLNRTASRYNQLIEKRLQQISLEVPIWRVLMILGEQSPQPIGRIADQAVINISTMARIIERMRRARLVEPVPSKTDGRVTELHLTPFGEERLSSARKLTAPLYERAIRGFSAHEFRQFLNLITRLHDNLEE